MLNYNISCYSIALIILNILLYNIVEFRVKIATTIKYNNKILTI